MAIHVIRVLADGATVVRDPVDGAVFALKAGQWEEVELLPPERRRPRLEELVIANRTAGDPRSEAEQNQIDAASQGQGERHEQEEEAR